MYSDKTNQELQLLTASTLHAHVSGKSGLTTISEFVLANKIAFSLADECTKRGISSTVQIEKSDLAKPFTTISEMMNRILKRIDEEWNDIKLPAEIAIACTTLEALWEHSLQGDLTILETMDSNKINEKFIVRMIMLLGPLFVDTTGSGLLMGEAKFYLLQMMINVEAANMDTECKLKYLIRAHRKDPVRKVMALARHSAYMACSPSYHMTEREWRKAEWEQRTCPVAALPSEYTSNSGVLKNLWRISDEENERSLNELDKRVNDMFIEQKAPPVHKLTSEDEDAIDKIRIEKIAEMRARAAASSAPKKIAAKKTESQAPPKNAPPKNNKSRK